MKSQAFCPAHVTGFFKAEISDAVHSSTENTGSVGAGFSIKAGVTTTVQIGKKQQVSEEDAQYHILTNGFKSDNTKVSEHVIKQFLALKNCKKDYFFEIQHEISVPVGYGLGCSGAVALSLAYALDQILNTRLTKEQIGKIAHQAEVTCKTGLGDVLASYHGGFEIRTVPGAPGIGRVQKIKVGNLSAIIICFAPMSTAIFLRDRLPEINGLGGKMVNKLKITKSWLQFQDMSLEFANYVRVITPPMKKVIDEFHANKIKCGVALFGQTVFSLASNDNDVKKILGIASKYKNAIIINSEIDQLGAKIVS